MKNNNISRKYNGTALFGSIFGSLLFTTRSPNRQQKGREAPLNLRRA